MLSLRDSVRDFRARYRGVQGSPVAGPTTARHRFSFIFHFPDADAVRQADPSYEGLSDQEIENHLALFAHFHEPAVACHLPAVRSAAGAVAEGWLVAVPYSAQQMLELPRDLVLESIGRAVALSHALGAGVVGLGAFTSIVSGGGTDMVGRGPVITTGNALTVIMAVEAALQAAGQMGIAARSATAMIVGASGSIGSAAAALLAARCRRLVLVGNGRSGSAGTRRLQEVAEQVTARAETVCDQITLTQDMTPHLPAADIILTATSAVQAVLVDTGAIRPGAVVIDVGRPPNVSERVSAERSDVLVLEGGLVQWPVPVQFGQNFGLRPGVQLACLSETMLLALEGSRRDCGVGRRLSLDDVDHVRRLALDHGLKLAAPRSFGREVTPERIALTRRAAYRRAG